MPVVTSTARRIWRRLRELASHGAQRLETASIPIELDPADGSGKINRIAIRYPHHSQVIWLQTKPDQIRSVVTTARKSWYGKSNRIGGSIIHGSLAAAHPPVQAARQPLRCLFIGYGLDTYDAQLLANLGWRLRADFVDVLDQDRRDPRWVALRRTPGILEANYCQLDARHLGSRLAGEQYDFISIVRGSVDLMVPDDFMAVLCGCYDLLASNGVTVFPALTLQFTATVLTALRRRFWFGESIEPPGPSYESKLGAFQLARLGQYRFLEVAFENFDFDVEQATRDQLAEFAPTEPAFSELGDLLPAEATPDWFKNMATYHGQSGRILAPADLPGRTRVGAFDISRRPRDTTDKWSFTARTTLVMRRLEPADGDTGI